MAAANKYNIRPTSSVSKYFTPSNTGILVGAALAAFPNIIGQEYDLYFFNPVFNTGVLVPRRLFLGAVGILAGYVSANTIKWLKWRLVTSLLTYQGWIFSPKSQMTKAWAVLMKLLISPGNHSTHSLQPYLPKLPLPALDATLDRWLEVAEPLVTVEEYERTQLYVKQFRNNEGPILQKHLAEKAKTSKSWISDYWNQFVYLANRQSLAVNSNYFAEIFVNTKEPQDQVARAAAVIRNIADFHDFLTKEQLPPSVLGEVVPLCMNGYKYLFNTSRIPLENLDEMRRFPEYSHIIIIRKGHYFKVDLHYQYSSGSLVSETDLLTIIQDICNISDGLPNEVPVAALTGQKRDIWAKQRIELMQRNGQVIRDIETAVMVLSLNENSPVNLSQAAEMSLTGTVDNTWFDKSLSMTVFENGIISANVEHTGVDAMIFTSLTDFLILFHNNKEWSPETDALNGLRTLPVVEKLNWDLTDMKNNIAIAAKEMDFVVDNTEISTFSTKYGKGFIKKCKVSPDGYIQMMLQFAYYKIHGEFTKQYEPSTHRLFQLGRTETVNPMSTIAQAWIRAMEDATSPKETKTSLLQKAIEYQTKYRLEATAGKACDRHLFALMCAAMELGVDMPSIFLDKPWRLPYKLSTSQSPTRVMETDANHVSIYAGFGPSCHDGYGISYLPKEKDSFSFCISSFKNCESTSSARMSQAIVEAMDEMRSLYDNTQ